MAVDMTTDIAEFLTSRRARVTPEQTRLPTYGKRRVPGLRHLFDLARAVNPVGARRGRPARWAAHNVRFHRTGAKRIQHPVVGHLDLRYEAMELSADSGLTMTVYAAEPDSAPQQALDLLASWTATPDVANPAEVGDQAAGP